MNQLEVLRPQWPAPPAVHAACSQRSGGVSRAAYLSLNLGVHVGDDPAAVADNRLRLQQALALPARPLWLSQIHGSEVVQADLIDAAAAAAAPQGDAAISRQPGRVLAVLVADCMPVLLCRRDGTAVAVAHAGWRGLAAGVLEAAVAAFGVPGDQLVAWLGPAIGQEHFEVGAEVRAAFCQRDPRAESAFIANARGRWQCDLHGLAQARLHAAGVRAVHGTRHCTFSQPQAFFSHRRDGVTGRCAVLIWIDPGSAT